MPFESQDYQDKKQLLEILLDINKNLRWQQYRLMALKAHNQKKIKLINPHDPQFFYLN